MPSTPAMRVSPRRRTSRHRTSATPQIRLQILGEFTLSVAGERLRCPLGGQRVLAYLALCEHPQSRTRVAGSLWPETTDERAAANLRSSLWRLPAVNAATLVDSVGHSLALSNHVDVDSRRAQELGWACVRNADVDIAPHDAALFYEVLLPCWYDEWVIMERERLEQLRLNFLEAVAFALLRRSHPVDALDVALRLVAADPLREASQRVLISVHRSAGNVGQAIRQLDRYRGLLRDTFDCDPSPDLVELATGERPDGSHGTVIELTTR